MSPLIYQFGPFPLLFAMLALFLFATVGGLLYFGPKVRQERQREDAAVGAT